MQVASKQRQARPGREMASSCELGSRLCVSIPRCSIGLNLDDMAKGSLANIYIQSDIYISNTRLYVPTINPEKNMLR